MFQSTGRRCLWNIVMTAQHNSFFFQVSFERCKLGVNGKGRWILVVPFSRLPRWLSMMSCVFSQWARSGQVCYTEKVPHGCLPPTPTVVIFTPFSHSVDVLVPICALMGLMVIGQMHRDTENLCVSKKDAGITHRSQEQNHKKKKQ